MTKLDWILLFAVIDALGITDIRALPTLLAAYQQEVTYHDL